MKNLKALKGKDLITIAIFTVIIAVLNMIVGMIIMFINFNVAMISSMAFVSLISTGIYMLMAAKVKKPGVMLLFGILTGIIHTIMSIPIMLVIAIVPAIIGELVVSVPKKNNSLVFNAISYGIFNCTYALHGSFIILYMGKERFRAMGGSMFSEEQTEAALEAAFNGGLILLTIAVTALGCFIGYFIGKKLLKRNFEKAGVI